MAITNDPAFSVYALSAVFISVHMILLDSYSGVVRAKAKVTPNKEDARSAATVALEEPEEVARVMRAHRNLLVNAVPLLVLGLVMVLLGTTKTTAMAYFGTFIVARLGHTFAYLGGKQPWRSIFFTIGQLAILGVAYQVVRGALAGL
ncbi:MAG: MAPEG family protein [Myxococcales bacterium]|nr:MAPEG family protein [Myxococcales bacterium]